jgi:hypothetical protein
MASPLSLVAGLIAADTALLAVHGGRVCENSAPQKTPFPRVVIEASGRDRAKTHDGTSSLQSLAVRVQLQARDKDSPEAMRERVSVILDGLRATLGGGTGITVLGSFERGAPDEYEPAVHANEEGVFVIACDYDLRFISLA